MSDNLIERGEHARDFTIENTKGEPITLSYFEGEKIVYLVFNRGFQ